MDTDCDYFVYRIEEDSSSSDADDADDTEAENEARECVHCAAFVAQPEPFVHSSPYATAHIPFDQALSGRMVPHLEVFEQARLLEQQSDTLVRYVARGKIRAVGGSLHMQDIPPNGTWLTEMRECAGSTERLRLAGLACVHLPELNRVVLEQKNDDGLLHMVNTCLADKPNLSESIALFGPFACDALLAPVLHKILRSKWIENRKARCDAGNYLKLGWAQELYDLTRLTIDKNRSRVFGRGQLCGTRHREEGDAADVGSNTTVVVGDTESEQESEAGEENIKLKQDHLYNVVDEMLRDMRQCGYTPWSAVNALRVKERRITEISCVTCRQNLLASGAFLMECAAVESSKAHDWLVRNEAVIQLCWLMYHIHRPPNCVLSSALTEAWAGAISAHCTRFHQYEPAVHTHRDPEIDVVMFAVDHLPVAVRLENIEEQGAESEEREPALKVIEYIRQNRSYSKQEFTGGDSTGKPPRLILHLAVDTPYECQGDAEARAQCPEALAAALVLCFPRVASSAQGGLTLRAPVASVYANRPWPVHVNSTRACYALFKHLAIPPAPSPVYLLEVLARAWRLVPQNVLNRFVPMSSGGTTWISSDRYANYFLRPVNLMRELSLVSEAEQRMTIKTLRLGVLPCFVGLGDSFADRLVSSTSALAFAACGVRVCSNENRPEQSRPGDVAVTFAGLLYFAAWYLMVYATAVHTVQILKDTVRRKGTDADKYLCTCLSHTMESKEAAPAAASADDGVSVKCKGEELLLALRLLFGDTVDDPTVVRVVELYGPEFLAQLPHARRIRRIPNSVKSALESRDFWFASEHNPGLPTTGQHDPPFVYLGEIAHGLRSSIRGTLIKADARPVARALRSVVRSDRFDPWCDCLVVCYSDISQTCDYETRLRAFLQDDSLRSDDVIVPMGSGECKARSSPPQHRRVQVTEENAEHCGGQMLTSDGQSGGPLGPAPPNGSECWRICRGFSTPLSLGFDKNDGRFLSIVHLDAESEQAHRPRTQRARILEPCMVGMYSTVCVKTDSPSKVPADTLRFGRLVDALWVLLMYDADRAEEPRTPEALAVMIHLASKRISEEATKTADLRTCNDIQRLYYRGSCHTEHDFVTVAAIVAGLFSVNLDIHTRCFLYDITIEQNGKIWAPNPLYRKDDMWHVPISTSDAVPPREKSNAACHHGGTLAAYIRLNELRVIKVPSDNHCGFHTAAVLLDMGSRCDDAMMALLVRRTAEYIFGQAKDDNSSGCNAYLLANKCRSTQELIDVLATKNRWLSVDELTLMLRAHGKLASAITEHAYPIRSPNVLLFSIARKHFEPVVPVAV